MSTALISVSDKTGIVEFAKELKNLGWDIISSGGTAKILKENSIDCKEISEVTGFPEILDGRVKTLNSKIHGGILAIRNKNEHIKQLQKHNIGAIDMVVVNLYPFEETINKIPKPEDKKIAQDVIENIDIGGVALLRAAAKNYKDVMVICDSKDYSAIVDNLKSKSVNEDLKLNLAAKAFRHTAYYDSLISNYLTYEKFPTHVSIPLKKLSGLRYGENPHQEAALYSNGTETNKSIVISAKQIHGKELSYNNYLDLESAWRLVHEFDAPACAIIKHNNPCGCAEGIYIKDAYLKALSCDPISAFGGIIAFNKFVEEDTAEEISKLFVECVIAQGYSKNALDILTRKKNIRLLVQEIPYKEDKNIVEYRMMSYGMLAQDRDNLLSAEIKLMTRRQPTKEENDSLNFAWKIAKHVKSNAIILARGRQTVGIGAGQMSRIDSLKIAVEKMKDVNHTLDEKKFPLVLASDAFFPFSDVVEESAKAGVTAIIQPGGSIKDEDSVKAADDRNIAMVATGIRHFKH
ncbi:bifunctional phosphoribosylaminoimidazolecarboxamide formyltransferase/IMP cyclohydrolase [Candidatus Endomicrobiellum devescovinae]|uniref:bifunctional phosphoribosylaminoimidazolecarboxamide formyltransferase/IMP cyclohydrolase n=1 Tax=Candidatus Endomicrobiellum devescovinae TaxID=3242322 RepID=UPI0028199401|nr:bifunctional phosphoribosylaminoimidazolecarboxamide formyltransferase/IMP cyclohydrolase [Endomicrobium sp.]